MYVILLGAAVYIVYELYTLKVLTKMLYNKGKKRTMQLKILFQLFLAVTRNVPITFCATLYTKN